MKKIVPYYFNNNYITFMKEIVDVENPENVAFSFHSIHEFHDALASTHEELRAEAKFLLEVIKYCRNRGTNTLFYGFKNHQKERLFDRMKEKKNKLHSLNNKIIKKMFAHNKALKQPYWAYRSKRQRVASKLLRLNDKHFLKDPYKLHESVLKDKIKNVPENSVVFSHYQFYQSLKCVG